ncbi:helix-turn-helix domain-containing protein [Paeniglutamicibacter antarcticus]|uniref:Helix-turn-helix domain-containing protein n=1 Tax=Arthrobacter terrae TaxID=2935737 RepID=A0A931CMF3_9MICC|nr:helix-turn-helix domain-containing protein [Arthrobacter terrae]MBG0738845.1 helix-turn-helix domain-containing protein [Arthrobacter terrae]
MTTQLPLPMITDLGAVLIGASAALLENPAGDGRVFLNGQLAWVWDAGQDDVRKLAAVQLVLVGAGPVNEVAAGFGVTPESLRRWRITLADEGVAALAPVKKGPKGPTVLTGDKATEIRRIRAGGASLRATAAAAGVSTDTVRRALTSQETAPAEPAPTMANSPTGEPPAPASSISPVLPVLPEPVVRAGERAASRAGLLECAEPVFTPAGKVPLAGLFLALPALEVTGLLACGRETFGALPDGFYGLDTIFLDTVFRTLAGEPRAEGATRFDPAALGRVLGMDRAPEVKTIRRKLHHLAGMDKAGELQKAMAIKHLGTGTGGGPGEELAAVLYVDGHVRAYQGRKKIGKIHSTRLKFPVPATEETWVSDCRGAPVLIVMAAPGAALTGELRALLPSLRTIIGDNRRVLVGFDRGGWSPALFQHMAGKGFDVLTWRKGTTEEIPSHLFTTLTHTDDHGEPRTWTAADTNVDLPLGTGGEVFRMRQITRIVPARGGLTRQIHILTTTSKMPAGEVIHRMGARWRQENYFRYARMHFGLDSHDAYASTDDDPDRSVPNPAKRAAYQQVLTARTQYAQTAAATDTALLAARKPAPGTREITITNKTHNTITAGLWDAETALEQATTTHQGIPARVRLEELSPGQQVLDTQMKLLTHAIRMAAFNTATTLAREMRTNTGYARAAEEAHTLIRHALTHSGDIDPTEAGHLTIRLDPFPTKRATTAISELCEHLTTTKTRYPGTDLIMRYEVKTAPPAHTQ